MMMVSDLKNKTYVNEFQVNFPFFDEDKIVTLKVLMNFLF